MRETWPCVRASPASLLPTFSLGIMRETTLDLDAQIAQLEAVALHTERLVRDLEQQLQYTCHELTKKKRQRRLSYSRPGTGLFCTSDSALVPAAKAVLARTSAAYAPCPRTSV
jgi:hypothetical protein